MNARSNSGGVKFFLWLLLIMVPLVAILAVSMVRVVGAEFVLRDWAIGVVVLLLLVFRLSGKASRALEEQSVTVDLDAQRVGSLNLATQPRPTDSRKAFLTKLIALPTMKRYHVVFQPEDSVSYGPPAILFLGGPINVDFRDRQAIVSGPAGFIEQVKAMFPGVRSRA